MKSYQVRIKQSQGADTVRATSELGARVKFCEKRGLDYRAFASKIEVVRQAKRGDDKATK